MAKTYAEINEKIRRQEAVVVTAEEIIDIVAEKGVEAAAREIDVVTTGTFGPMCSSGAVINIGHSKPKIKIQQAWINDVNLYAGLAAVDLYIGATEVALGDTEFRYGGGYIIEDLVAGKDLRLKATSYGTSCYPRKELDTLINIKDLNQATLLNPRNGYQNYNCAINRTEETIYTYMGVLKPNIANATYCSAGQLSPLLNDPYLRTIGVGTRIFIGGAPGYVYWEGTQHNPNAKRKENGVPCSPAGTIAVVGDLKQMSTKFLRGSTYEKYGVSLTVGLGIPIPILDEEMLKFVSVKDEDIYTQIVDYGNDYPNGISKSYGEVNYAQLKTGSIEIEGKSVPTAPLSSYAKAREIAGELKQWIQAGEFLLQEPLQALPQDQGFKGLNYRP